MPMQLLDEKEIQQLRSQYMSDNTSYMRWSTEIEPKKDVIDGDFMSRNKIQIMFADKFAPLANFNEPKQGILHKLKLLNVTLAQNAGLETVCEESAISAIDDIQLSRGDKGFYQKALITQRQELQEERTDTQKKVGFFNKLFGGGKKQEDQQVIQQ